MSDTADQVATSLTRTGRWSIPEILFWLVAAATLFVLPERHLILNEIAIIGLFAVSLDLILGYAGIVSLGHAAFFGLGAYAAGLLAKNGFGDPLAGLVAAAAAAALLGFATSFLVLRGADLTRLMVTLGVALVLGEIANQASWLTGGADGLQGIVMGPIFGLFEFDIFGTTAYAYSLTVTFVLFVLARRIVVSPVGLFAPVDPRQPAQERGRSAFRSTAGSSPSIRSRRPMRGLPERSWRRPRNSSPSTCSPSTVRRTSCSSSSSAASVSLRGSEP